MGKSPEAFRTISEVAEDLKVPKHVLRFWEGKFSQLRPMKRGGGRRYYRPEDVELLRGIRQLLYDDGFTIKGVQKILREQGVSFVVAYSGDGTDGPPPVRDIPDVASEAARSAAEGKRGTVAQDARLSREHAKQLRQVLAELDACRKLLAEATKT